MFYICDDLHNESFSVVFTVVILCDKKYKKEILIIVSKANERMENSTRDITVAFWFVLCKFDDDIVKFDCMTGGWAKMWSVSVF